MNRLTAKEDLDDNPFFFGAKHFTKGLEPRRRQAAWTGA
jgi:hypothetical protein